MNNNKYIVKNLAPWMLDELIAMSEITSFELFFLRNQNKFYDEGLKQLEKNGIKIFKNPFKNKFDLKKYKLVTLFICRNILRFKLNYNFAIGVKSILWFLRLDLTHFDQNSKIHAQFATQAALISKFIKKYYNNKPDYSFTFHAYDIYFRNEWFNQLITSSFYGFSISNYNIKYIQKNYTYSDKVKLSRLGVFRNANHISQIKDRDKFFQIGLLSWFTDKKGIFYLLDAIKELKDKKKYNFKLVLAGDGPLKDKILEYIKNKDLQDKIEYIGVVKDDAKEAFYSSLDAFVLPSISLKNDQDGIPVVLMEAIAYGLPIISTKVSGIPEICINDYNGLLIKEKNVHEIVDAIERIMSDKETRERFSKMSLELSKSYDIRINAHKKIKLLRW